MRVLLFGANGQLGHAIAATLGGHCELVCATRRPEDRSGLLVDLLQPKTVELAISSTRPDILINAAAYTGVDQAEDDRQTAWRVNSDAVAVMAGLTKRYNGLIMHFSTDYVFAGTGNSAYQENDPIDPCNHYGASKFAGEEAIRCLGVDHLVFRTSWLYSLAKKNFATTIISKANNKQALRVVDDQVGQPTSVDFICRSLKQIVVERNNVQWLRERTGTYHLSTAGQCSWFDFAETIVAHTRQPHTSLERTTSAEFATRAQRPSFSVLATDKVAQVFGLKPPHWRDEANAVLAEAKHPVRSTSSGTNHRC